MNKDKRGDNLQIKIYTDRYKEPIENPIEKAKIVSNIIFEKQKDFLNDNSYFKKEADRKPIRQNKDKWLYLKRTDNISTTERRNKKKK